MGCTPLEALRRGGGCRPGPAARGAAGRAGGAGQRTVRRLAHERAPVERHGERRASSWNAKAHTRGRARARAGGLREVRLLANS